MEIIADPNIPFANEAFKDFGRIKIIPGREIDNKVIRDADILLVRSVTKVNHDLLAGTKVKFVATSTIGCDHVDIEYLKENSIGFTNAPGSNANSVAEYVVAGVLHLCKMYNFNLSEKIVGIIGVGNVGGRVRKKLEILGAKCLLNDPPKMRETGDRIYLPLAEVLPNSDIVTVHVPLNKVGMDSTLQLINEEFLGRMKRRSILINTSRGKVMDEAAVRKNRAELSGLIIDVWETEPGINTATLQMADIGTPHIAGFSFDGNVRGTEMIYEAACRFFQKQINWDKSKCLKPDKELTIDLKEAEDPVFAAVNAAYPIMRDHENLKQMIGLEKEKQGDYFDQLKQNYPVRREFHNYSLLNNVRVDKEAIRTLEDLGFKR